MKSKPVITLFIISLPAALLSLVIVNIFGSPQSQNVTVKALFGLTVLVEIAAFSQALAARRTFARSDPGHLTWSLIVAFLAVRLLAELRLATITFDLVQGPKFIEPASPVLFFYVIALRYLYTVSDLLFIGALLTTVRAYRSTGLKFELLKRDYLYIILLWAVPATTFAFRANLSLTGLTAPDPYIPAYRLVAVGVGAVIASLCVVVRRYAVQMGGGAVARVWNTVVIAGIARDASFLALAMISPWWESGAKFAEQFLLWVFAGCWLVAALCQQEVLSGLTTSSALRPAETGAAG